MIPRLQRISTQLFKEIIQKGGFSHGDLFILRILKRKGISRFSVVVPKKVTNKAVLRGRIRRQIYSVIRKLWPRINKDFLVIIIMKEGSEKISFNEISKEIEKGFVKYGLLK